MKSVLVWDMGVRLIFRRIESYAVWVYLPHEHSAAKTINVSVRVRETCVLAYIHIGQWFPNVITHIEHNV